MNIMKPCNCLPLSDIDISTLLQKKTIQASAPVRIDFGGSWDLKAPALIAQKLPPVSINAALKLHTTVKLLPCETGIVKVSARDFTHVELPPWAADLTSPLGLVLAILLHFRVSGVHVIIESESPPESGLGGSGTLAVAVIGAVSEAIYRMNRARRLSRTETVRLAHDIEESLSISLTGMQDQAAAAFGGINMWQWDYRSCEKPLIRKPLLSKTEGPEFEEHLLLVLLAKRPAESGPSITQRELEGFLSGTTRGKWFALHQASMDFARAVSSRNWSEAALHLKHGTAIRLIITPHIADPCRLELIREAERCGCGAGFAGDGKRALWATGPAPCIARLRKQWQAMFESSVNGGFLDCEVDFQGLTVS